MASSSICRPRQPGLVRKLQERRETHRDHGLVYRAAFATAGVVILLAGLAMLVLPGPALVIIPIGLAIISLEFAAAAAALVALAIMYNISTLPV
jgi:Putative transmembrane protein (PGPGW)